MVERHVRETHPQNLIFGLQGKKRKVRAPQPRTLSVSANLALSVEKMHLNSATSAAPGETWEPRGLPTHRDPPVSLYPFLRFPCSPSYLLRAPLCLWGLLSMQQPLLMPLCVLPQGPLPTPPQKEPRKASVYPRQKS